MTNQTLIRNNEKKRTDVFDGEVARLRRAAIQALEINHTPPQRYGTAFHITPPVQDVRELSTQPGRAESQSMNQTLWDEISQEDQQRLLSVDFSDVYLAWHLAHLDCLPTRLIHVPEGESRTFDLTLPSSEQRAASSELYWIIVEPQAQITITEQLINAPLALRRMFVWQKEGSRLHFTGLRANNQFLNEQIHIELLGQGASARLMHLTIGNGSAQADVHAKVAHRARQTVSDVGIRSAAAGTSRTVYRGRIHVDRAAAGTSGYQHGKALLLSNRAVVDMLPELEIKTNDVRCSHGVTTTHVDDRMVFYMRSRGLDKQAARALALMGFFHHHIQLPSRLAAELERCVRDYALA